MAALQQAAHHIGSHPAEADHSELHGLALHGGSMFRSDLAGLSGRGMQVCPLEQIYELAIAPRDFGDSLLARRFFAPPGDQRIPKSRAADRKADEARHTGRHRKPVSHFLIVLTAAENDATNPIAASRPGRCHNLLAILAPIETLNLPKIRFDAGVLELADSLDHQARPHLAIIDLLIALELVELRLLRRHKELEHEPTAVLVGKKIGQTLQSSRLFFV